MKTRIYLLYPLIIALTMVSFAFNFPENNKELFEANNIFTGKNIDFKSAAIDLKNEKSPYLITKNADEKKSAVLNNDWSNDSKNTLTSAGFDPDKFRPEEIFGINGISDSIPIEATSVRTYTGMSSSGNFGYSVSSAGDVNGDGYSDIIVGAYNYSSGTGRVYIYFGGLTQQFNPNVILTGESNTNYFGRSVSSAGDFNGDGYSDIIVGADGYNTNTGRAYIYYGGAVMNNTADVTMTGETTSNYFGISVSSAGDVNGDGYSDVIVGANGYTTYTGRAYVYFGGISNDATVDVILTGYDKNKNFGVSVSSAGDMNGDGYSDVIVGADLYSRAFLYLGNRNMDTTADAIFKGGSGNYGLLVSSAGDVNGDGYSDVMVGAPYYNVYVGSVSLYYGGSVIDTTADIIFNGEGTNNSFGKSATTAGDINGDGYSDVIIGAYMYGSYTGRAYVYFGGTAMDNTPDMTLTGETTSSYFGFSVSTAGDVNGDGYADVIVGAYHYSSQTGRVYVFMNSMTGTDIPDMFFTGAAAGDYFGYSVSKAGDVNGDGYSDVIIGAPTNDIGGTDAGRAYIYFGGISPDNTADVILTGAAAGDAFGYSVSTAGDVNGDGYSDVIVGALYNDIGGTNAGRAYIYFGDISPHNTADVILTGAAANDDFGISVASAGDVNGDGYSDVIVGAPYNDAGGTDAGRAYIYFGGISPDNTADVTLTGAAASDYFGMSVSSAGDVNGDVYSDVIIGAPYNDAGGSDAGRAYVYFGGISPDNYADVTLTGAAAGDNFGFSVSTAGDVNGDGYSDVIVGAYNNDLGGTNAGRAYIYFGGISPDNIADVILTEAAAGDNFGYSLSTAGDVNGDGYSDVIVGANKNDLGGTNAGRAYIYFGGISPDNIADVILTGAAAYDNFGFSVSIAGDVNGDGYSDVIVGASFNDAGGTDAGRAYVYITQTPPVKPTLVSVQDFPKDEGGKVVLNWARSAYDITGSSTITAYLIQKAINGSNFWEDVTTVTARQQPYYAYTASTNADSVMTRFRITALTSNLTVFWRSGIKSGFSVDNLAPSSPLNVIASSTPNLINLSWKKNTEPDLKKYRVYRNDTLISESYSNAFTDTIIHGKSLTNAPFIKESDNAEDNKISKLEKLENNTRPVYLYTYEISAVDIHGNEGELSAPLNVNFAPFTKLTLTVIPEGFYNTSTGRLNSRDTITVYLRRVTTPYAIVDSAKAVLDSVTFTADFNFKYAETGTYYYVIKHRNSIETWSKSRGEVFTRGNDANYNFTSANTQAYGNNLIQKNGLWCIFTGDVNQDGTIDLNDAIPILSDYDNLEFHLVNDLNLDGTIDLNDAIFVLSGYDNLVGAVIPAKLMLSKTVRNETERKAILEIINRMRLKQP